MEKMIMRIGMSTSSLPLSLCTSAAMPASSAPVSVMMPKKPPRIMKTYGKEVHVSIGSPISVERQNECGSVEALGEMLRAETYKLKPIK